jgi:transposase-like protein
MVRNYQRKTVKSNNYSPEDLARAVNEVKNGSMSLKMAASEYNIPKPTLHHHISGVRGKSKTGGRSPVIPFQMEESLASG